jgi:hypothetical protein
MGEGIREVYNPNGSTYFIAKETEFTKEEMTELIKLIQKEFGEEKEPYTHLPYSTNCNTVL